MVEPCPGAGLPRNRPSFQRSTYGTLGESGTEVQLQGKDERDIVQARLSGTEALSAPQHSPSCWVAEALHLPGP
jgi:hypothetical protein